MPRHQCYETFYGLNLRMFKISQTVCLWQTFPAYSNARKVGVYPIEAPPGLTHKHQTKLERFARDKHSSLLYTLINYWRKMFYNIGPWNRIHNTHYFLCNLCMGPKGQVIRFHYARKACKLNILQLIGSIRKLRKNWCCEYGP